MNVNQVYTGNFLKAADLGNTRAKVTISKVTLEEMDDKTHKLCIHFIGKQLGLLLNKTNAFIIAQAFGDESDSWKGQSIEIYSHQVMFQGKPVQGIAVQASAPQMATQAAQAPLQQSAGHQPQPGDALQAIADQVAQAEAEKQRQELANQAFSDDDIPF